MSETFGARLRRLREEGCLSKRSLARIIGVTPNAIRFWEAGAFQPYAKHVDALERLFECDFSSVWLPAPPMITMTANPTKATLKNRRWNEAHREKRAAHQAVHKALFAGRLKRCPCERCGEAVAQAHHDDYSRPLEVTWLCPKHHRQRHRELRAS